MIPRHDEHFLPPHLRTNEEPPELAALILPPDFYKDRDEAFHFSFKLPRLLSFFDTYGLPYKQPMNPLPNPQFWAMVYTAVLASGAGSKGEERAKIWLFTCQHVQSFSLEDGLYRMYGKTFHLPLLLRKRRDDRPLKRQHRILAPRTPEQKAAAIALGLRLCRKHVPPSSPDSQTRVEPPSSPPFSLADDGQLRRVSEEC